MPGGDPETQAVLPRLKSDWVDVMEAALDHRLDQTRLEWREESSVCVVLASEGYPEHIEKGRSSRASIRSTFRTPSFFTPEPGDRGSVGDAGGRVLGVTALGQSVAEARRRAYQAVDRISFRGMHYRKDIGASAG